MKTATSDDLRRAITSGMETDEIKALFDGTEFTNDVDISGLSYPHRFELQAGFKAFRARDANFHKTVDLSGCTFDGGLDLRGMTVGGDLRFDTVTVKGLDGENVAILLDEIRIGRGLEARSATLHKGLWLKSARVGASVDLSGIQIENGILDFENATVGGNLRIRTHKPPEEAEKRPSIAGRVKLNVTKVRGRLVFDGATLKGGLEIDGSTFGGLVRCRNCEVGNAKAKDRTAVRITSSRLLGQLDLCGSNFTGHLWVRCCRIGDNLSMSQRLTQDCARETTVQGDVVLTGSRVDGETELVGVHVTGAFVAVRSLLDDGLLFNRTCGTDSEKDVMSRCRSAQVGRLDVRHARVGGELNLHKLDTTDIGTESAPNFDLGFIRVDGVCRLPPAHTAVHPGGQEQRTMLNLNHARVSELRFEERKLPFITADGIAFKQLTLTSDEQYVRFLDHVRPFQKSAYHFTENHLRESGKDETADAVFREAQRRERRRDVNIETDFGEWAFRFDVWLFETVGGGGWHRKVDEKKKERVDDLFNYPDERPARGRAEGTRPLILLALVALAVVTAVIVGQERMHRWGAGFAYAGYAVAGAIVLALAWMSLRWLRWAWLIFIDVTTGYGTATQRLLLFLATQFFGLTVLFSQPQSVKRATNPTLDEVEEIVVKNKIQAIREQLSADAMKGLAGANDIRNLCGQAPYRNVVGRNRLDEINKLVESALLTEADSAKRAALEAIRDHARFAHPDEQNKTAEPDYSPDDLGKDWRWLDASFVAVRTTVPLIELVTDKDWEPSEQHFLPKSVVRFLGNHFSARLADCFRYDKLAGLVSLLGYVTIPLFLASLSGWLKKRGES